MYIKLASGALHSAWKLEQHKFTTMPARANTFFSLGLQPHRKNLKTKHAIWQGLEALG